MQTHLLQPGELRPQEAAMAEHVRAANVATAMQVLNARARGV